MDEPLSAGSPYIFVSSSERAEAATATMAVLGPHAFALAQEPVALDTVRTFKAVRMHRRTSPTQNGAETVVWDIMFSTGNLAQERELQGLVGLAD